jgi:hypothetical protein
MPLSHGWGEWMLGDIINGPAANNSKQYIIHASDPPPLSQHGKL